MITSKLTSKAQTTISEAVRVALHLREGDEIAYIMEGDTVVIRKAAATAPAEDPFGIFSEWDSEADRKAYAEL